MRLLNPTRLQMQTDKTYTELLTELKKKIRQGQHRIALSVNTEMFVLYWSMGNDISIKIRESGWGAKVIDSLSKDLRRDLPNSRGFSVRNLKYKRAFTGAYPDFLQGDLAKSGKAIVQPLAALLENTEYQKDNFVQEELAQIKKDGSPIVQGNLAQLSWYHHITLMDKVKDKETSFFYMNAIEEQKKSERDNPTIGVLLFKTPNETVIKYALRGINSPLGVADYQLPKKLKSEMPTIYELEAVIKKSEVR